MAMRNIKEAGFPKPIQSDPNQRDPSLWCEFHGTHDHRIKDYQYLCKEVATLLMNDHLREFLSDHAKNNYGRIWHNVEPTKTSVRSPSMNINMVFGGNEVNGLTFSVAKKMMISMTHKNRL